jgi:hypothetical protein
MDHAQPSDIYRQLEEEFQETALSRPMKIGRYEAGTELTYDVTGLCGSRKALVELAVERFVGGGFAGQVYQVKVLDIDAKEGSIEGLEEGGMYAMKVFIPPTTFSRLFRNMLYLIGFQGPFQIQVNPSAARAGALWQQFFKRGAKITFGNERAVADIYATFVDSRLGSCGELSEWIEGRTWRLEVDDRLDLLRRWRRGKEVDTQDLGSPEYRAKREFMYTFVELLNEMGGHEFARQYEWTTWKSQPNCLKRDETEGSPSEGLVAVDFRAGLALLPFLPMSPGDFKLIAQGLIRGSLVQFDRGDIGKLEQFMDTHRDEFSDMRQTLQELKEAEQVYRYSIPDITHHHISLLYRAQIWATILGSAVTGWRIRDLIDEQFKERLWKSTALIALFLVIGILPFLGKILRRIWGHKVWRRHYLGMLTSWDYLRRALRAMVIENVIGWNRSGRVDSESALKIARQVWRFSYHLPLSVLPSGLHKFFTNWQYAKERLDYLILRPVRLYFNDELREQWLRDMVTEGKKDHLVSEEDARVILMQVSEPFIQKYLKSLAVHLCTLPVTQIVSVLLAITYVAMHPEMPRGQAWMIGLGIIALFQVIPISPGSLVRGLYVLYLVVRERNFRDYNIAVFLGFFKYIGYLAFPIQMAYRYPSLARFMAGHWATEAVHIVPVFGERGALMEHEVFYLFYNWPLTIRRRMRERAQFRATLKPRYWHILLCAIGGAVIFSIADFVYVSDLGMLPGLKDIWVLAVIVPLLCGAAVTLGAGGAELWKRIIGAAICGGMVGLLFAPVPGILGYGGMIGFSQIAIACVWRMFVFTILSTIGALLMEFH